MYFSELFNSWVEKFVVESNLIEGIKREPTAKEIEISKKFIFLDNISLENIEEYVKVCQPNAKLRDQVGLNVYVGNHVPPAGGIDIKLRLEDFIKDLNDRKGVGLNPFLAHQFYETLHPFTDGNGRSGRIIWLWHMITMKKKVAPMGFLQTWYYQSLDNQRK